MNRALRQLSWAWLGYPGRGLILLGLLMALALSLWNLRTDWTQAAATLRAELRQQWQQAEGIAAEPEELILHPRVALAQREDPDGAMSPPAQQTVPGWLPLDHWSHADAAGRLSLITIPMHAEELGAELRQRLLPSLLLGLGLGLFFALWLSRPILALRQWLNALDQGRFAQMAPALPWPLDQIADGLRVLAERLRFTRTALHERQSSTDRDYRQQIRELQTELARYRQEQDASSALGDARGELLRTMSHEMRTPLTAIIGYADLLGRNDPSPEVAEYSGIISRSARNLLGMINNLLDLARIEAGALEAQLSSFDITELVEDTVALLAPLAFDKGLELSTLIYHDVPNRLRGDPLRIAQVLTNLLSNAIKYTDQGEVIVRLLVDRRDKEQLQLRIEVEDTGRGLDADQQQKLFQAWRRFEVAGSSAGGSGLGLAIVHKLLDALGGRIDVRSEPGQGSCFGASVPCQVVESRIPARWDGLRGLSVWVCETHPTATKALTHLLTFWEVDFRLWDHMGEMQEALADPRNPHPVQVVLLGLDSRGVSASAANDILSLPDNQRPPALVMVPSIDAASHRLWRERGAQAVLAKASPRGSLYDLLAQLALPADAPAPQPFSGLTVMVADNNRTGLRILQTQLQKLGAAVHCVESGAEALDWWSSNTCDLVLLDYHMPAIDGRQCAERMRASGQNPKALIVGMSAWLDAAEEESWKQAGVDAVLIKPFDMERLLRVMRQRHHGASPAQRKASSAPLLQDPEMAALLREELPRQWQALDEAFIAGQLRAVRDAAHQLHGTAAFLHLQPLQNELALFERSLQEARALDDGRLPDQMARIQSGVRALLSELDESYRAE